MTKTAEYMKQCADMRGDARLYRLSPPLNDEVWDSESLDYKVECYEYVVVSAVNAIFTGPETYIFPADKEGNITNWGELTGSFRGALDHPGALRNAGYTVAR